MRSCKPSVVRGVLTGMAAGIAATLVMDQFQKIMAAGQRSLEKHQKLAAGESPQQIDREEQQEQAAQEEGSTEKVARKLAEATGSNLQEENKEFASQAVHYTFGTLMGVVYGVTSELLPEVTTGGGTGFGTLLFLSADVIAVPALHLAPPPTEYAAADHLQHWAAHVVYGGALELVRSLVRRLF